MAILIYTIFSIIFISFLEFVDIGNFISFIFNSSYLYLSQNPYSPLIEPFPPNFFLFLIPTFFTFVYSGLNLFYYIFSFKIFQLVISILSSILIYKIVIDVSGSEHRAKAAFLSFLFSPFIFLINYVHTEQSPIGIFFALLSLYILLIFKEKRKNDFAISLAGSLLLWYSIFLYYFPAVLIPTLLIYQKTKKKFVNLLISLTLGFFYFYLPLKIINFWDFYRNIFGDTSISSHNLPVSTTSIFSINQILNFPLLSLRDIIFIQNNAGFIFNIIFIILIIIIPLLSRKLNYPIYSSFSLVLISLFILVNISNMDEYIWIIPFIIISFAISLKEKFLTGKLFLVQIYIVPVFIVFNLWGAPSYGSGTGIFYLSDLQFHNGLEIYHFIPYPFLFTKVMNFFTFISLIFLAQLLISKSRNFGYQDNIRFKYYLSIETIKNSLISLKNYLINIFLKFKSIHIDKDIKKYFLSKNLTFFIGLIIIFLLLFGNFIGGVNLEINNSNSNFPIGIFLPTDRIMNEHMSYELINNDHSVYITPVNYSFNYPPYNPLYFYRNLTDEKLDMGLKVSVINNYEYLHNITIFKEGPTIINLFNSINIPNESRFLSPYFINNSTLSYEHIPIVYGNLSIPMYNFTGASVAYYSIIPSDYEGYRFYILFHSDLQKWPQNELFATSYNNSNFQIQLFATSTGNYVLCYHIPGISWNVSHIWYNSNNYWNLVSFYINNTSITVNFNNIYAQSINYNFSNKSIPFILSVGKYWNYGFANYKYAFKGQISAIIASKNNISLNNENLYISYNDSKNNSLKFNYVPLKNNTALISINYFDNNLKIVSNNLSLNISNVSPILKFGRLSNSSLPLTFQITYLHLSADPPRPYFYNILIMDTILPLYIIFYIFIIWRNNNDIKSP
jgi:hypothetical protein